MHSAFRYFSAAIIATLFAATSAQAVPAFEEQTGQPCSACHVGGFGPQFTQFGRQFKMEGYTARGSDANTIPLAAMAIASYLNTAKDQPGAPAPHTDTNNNTALDQVSLFLAGGVGEHFGGFAQFTYDGVARTSAWDNLDLRAVTHADVGSSDVLFGVSLNNSPGVQDTWNTLGAWGFPYTDSALAPSPAAAPAISGTFAQSVVGVSAYAWIDSQFYTEAGLYWTPSRNFLLDMGVDPNESGVLKSAAPYFRAAYEKDYDDEDFQIGAFAFLPTVYPGGITNGGTDKYTDLGLDASYQWTSKDTSVYSLNARYTFERQNLSATFAAGGAADARNTLQDLRFDASYYWHDMVGVSVQPFKTWGSADSLLYAGNQSFKPDSSGVTLQLDGTPWGTDPSPMGPRVNMRVGVQYTAYGRFDGGSSNYDGSGRNASDNNTLRIFTWIAF